MPRQNPTRIVRKICYDEGDETEITAFLERSTSVKAASTGTRRRKLTSLSTLAIDILFEIFVYLHPLDVLNIMYTSRGFRTLLMASTSKFIWRAVRLNVDNFPDLPDDLSEFRYAKLAFDPHCHKCGKKTQNDPFWELRGRFCIACVNMELVHTQLCFYDGFLLENLLGIIEPGVARRGNFNPLRTFYCFKTHLRRFRTHLGTLPDADVQAWLTSEADRMEKIKEHAEKCIVWQNDVKMKRKADICRRLTALGMSEALGGVPPDAFNNHCLVNPAVALTDCSWNNIKEPLLQWLHEQDAMRLARLVLKMYKTEHPEMFLPGVQDFLALPEIQAVFKAPPAVPLSVQNFGDMRLPMENWRKNATLRIADLLVGPQKGNISHRIDAALHDRKLKTLKLATTVFSCSVCLKTSLSRDTESLEYAPAEYMHYPWVMAHPCVQKGQSDSGRGTGKLWDPKCLQHRVGIGRQFVKPILDACNLSSKTTTSAEMDTLDARFICLQCKDRKRRAAKSGDYITVYTWRSAINHALICRYRDSGNLWIRLSDNSATKIKTLTDCNGLESDYQRAATKPHWGCTFCAACDDEPSPMTQEEAIGHSLVGHDDDDDDDAWAYRLPRFPPGMFETVILRNQLDM